ncbi:MAG TPA: aromatic amino acid ammonia-lyase [Lacisediminihabitans sp.]|uniref:aromatic amino acid ammonia-lyase n=1 Tax=Lacisediminihabitans sp. TaxID=2787631 RepID=UPI002ED9FBAF
MVVLLGLAPVTVEQVVAVADGEPVALAPEAVGLLERSRAVVERAASRGDAVYGLTRRLGAARDVPVEPGDQAEFQRRTITNHLGGIGERLSERAVRATVFARLVGFTRGGSGVRPELAVAYASLLNDGVYPVVPSRGSVGAADLTQLAAIADVVTGGGRIVVDGLVVPGDRGPIELAPHEGLAVLSANSFSIGTGALLLDDLSRTADAADRSAALTLEAAGLHSPSGALGPFDPAIQSAHPLAGQARSAAAIRSQLSGSFLEEPGRVASVQDRLSVRTAPQVNGTLHDVVSALRAVLELELDSRSDNPLVDVDSGRMIPGGNFQAASLALTLESARLALAQVAALSERRIAVLSSLLAPFRASGRTLLPGLSWYSASAAVAELKHLANPVTLGSTSLSGEVEDHASLAPLALRLTERSVLLTAEVLAIEALHAADLIGLGPDAPLGTAELARGILDDLAAARDVDGAVRAAIQRLRA